MLNNQPMIIYHSPCLDGFTAAWAAWIKYPEAEFVPGVYGQDPPDVTDRTVYMVDFSYKRPVLEDMMEKAKRIVILDHHKSAQADLEGIEYSSVCPVSVKFDMEKSGARLAWEYFHPMVRVPELVQYVEDRDLWRFALKNSREVNAALFSHEYEFNQWTKLHDQMQICGGLYVLVGEGRAIERKHHKDIDELLSKTQHTRLIGGEAVRCANLPYTMASDAGHLMSKGEPFAATYYIDHDGYAVFSLRSQPEGADVSEIAKGYGGGGHKHAAGFRVKLEDLNAG